MIIDDSKCFQQRNHTTMETTTDTTVNTQVTATSTTTGSTVRIGRDVSKLLSNNGFHIYTKTALFFPILMAIQ